MSASSSRHFVVAGVIVPHADDAAIRGELITLRATLDRNPSDVLHFQKMTHSQRINATMELARFPVAVITSVIIWKDRLYGADGIPATFLAQTDPMYLWALRLLMERVSWYCDDLESRSPAGTQVAYVSFSAAINANTTESLIAVVPGAPTRRCRRFCRLFSTPGGLVMNGMDLNSPEVCEPDARGATDRSARQPDYCDRTTANAR